MATGTRAARVPRPFHGAKWGDEMGRLPLVSTTSEDVVLKSIFERINSRDIDVPNLYLTIANAPIMLQAWIGLTWPLRHEGTSPRSLRELVIMRVAQVEQATYEWAHHWEMAIASGISAEQLESIAHWETSGLFDDRQSAVLAYTDEVIGDSGVKDETFAKLRELFSDGEIVELTLAATFYLNLAHFARALRIETEPKYADFARRLPA
jgi:alkylhydroperoxidase family enzyme